MQSCYKEMDKYRCIVCGYIYDPDMGEPDNEILSGTGFENVPDTYVCPICGAPKDQFEKVNWRRINAWVIQ